MKSLHCRKKLHIAGFYLQCHSVVLLFTKPKTIKKKNSHLLK